MYFETVIIAITGPSGGGKSTFCKNLISQLPKNKSLLISQDSYYKDLSHLDFDKRASYNYDHPDSIDFNLLSEHLINLKKKKKISQPVYDFKTHCRHKNQKLVSPKEFIIVDGTLIISQQKIYSLFNHIIYIDLDQKICLERRIKRDINERGRTKKSVLEQYKKTVQPMFEEHIYPNRKNAHSIISGVNNSKMIEIEAKKIIKMKNSFQIM